MCNDNDDPNTERRDYKESFTHERPDPENIPPTGRPDTDTENQSTDDNQEDQPTSSEG